MNEYIIVRTLSNLLENLQVSPRKGFTIAMEKLIVAQRIMIILRLVIQLQKFDILALTAVRTCIYWVWGFHCGSCEKYCLVVCDAVQPDSSSRGISEEHILLFPSSQNALFALCLLLILTLPTTLPWRWRQSLRPKHRTSTRLQGVSLLKLALFVTHRILF
jgi:hypothetical protein